MLIMRSGLPHPIPLKERINPPAVMTEINISYPQLDHHQLAQCQINMDSKGVSELLKHFQRLFGKELKEAQIDKKGEVTSITFQASKAKIKLLESVIITSKRMTARLN